METREVFEIFWFNDFGDNSILQFASVSMLVINAIKFEYPDEKGLILQDVFFYF